MSKGPQSERDFWNVHRRKELVTANDEDKQVYETELSRLRNENKNLRDQLQRSCKELKGYQLKYPSQFFDLVKSENKSEETFPWTASVEIMSPLLEAYDSRIIELEELIKQKNQKLDNLKQNLEVLVQENELLRESHFETLQESSNQNKKTQFSSSNFNDLNQNAPLSSELMAEMRERIDILMDENALLVEQKVVLSNELDNHQFNLTQKSKEFNELNNAFLSGGKEMQFLKMKVKQLELERDEVAQQALSCSEALAKTEQENETLQNQFSAMKKKSIALEANVNELKNQIKSFADRNDSDNMNNIRRVKLAEDRSRELQMIIVKKTQDLDAITEINRKLRIEYQNTRQDAEGMLQVMSGLERQLNEYSMREDEIEKVSKFSKEKIEESIGVKEQCQVKENQYKIEIERLLNERKIAALHRTGEAEKSSELTKKVLNDQMLSFEKEMDEISMRNAKLISEAERANRENKATQDMFEKMLRLHGDQTKSMNSTVQDIAEKLSFATVSREQEIAKRVDVQEQNKDLRATIDKLRAQAEASRNLLNQTEKSNETEILNLKNQIRDFQKESAERLRIIARKSKEVDDLKASLATQLATIETKYYNETALYKRKAADADKFAKDLEATGFADDVRTQTLVDDLKEKYVGAVSHLESKLLNEIDQVKSLTLKYRNSEAALNDLLEEKAHALIAIEEAKSMIKQQEDDIKSYKSAIKELSGQLVSSYGAREESTMRAARAMEELNATSSSYNKNNYWLVENDKEMLLKDILSSYVSTIPISSSADAYRSAALLENRLSSQEKESGEK